MAAQGNDMSVHMVAVLNKHRGLYRALEQEPAAIMVMAINGRPEAPIIPNIAHISSCHRPALLSRPLPSDVSSLDSRRQAIPWERGTPQAIKSCYGCASCYCLALICKIVCS